LNNADSFLNGSNADYVDEMFRQWSINPGAVHASWDVYFKTGAYTPPPKLVADYVGSGTNAHAASTAPSASMSDVTPRVSCLFRVAQLIRGFQVRGHFVASLDPLKIQKSQPQPAKELELSNYGFSEADLDTKLDMQSLTGMLNSAPVGFLSMNNITIRQLYHRLKEIYCGHIGYEYMHIPDVEKCNWLRSKIETLVPLEYTAEQRVTILDRLTWADHFERALAKKYSTAKRFGLEGAESFIPGMKAIIDTSSGAGVESVVMGMPHRGRLNVLASVVRKPLEMILHEFDGTLRDEEEGQFSGDVKYHLGLSHNRKVGDRNMHMTLMANPSHLEAVAPVVVGKTRAKQFLAGDTNGSKSMALILHGDAAMSGQGIVFETFGLGSLEMYGTGGTIHVVVNNQVGFTTDPHNSRSSPYCSDVAKSVNAPIFHVNGDHPEDVVRVCELAAEFRAKFLSDVVIDIVCYRQHGHNEIDEPSFTQPLMYKNIRSKPSVLETYSKYLESTGKMTKATIDQISSKITENILGKFEAAKTYVAPDRETLGGAWGQMYRRTKYSPKQSTGVEAATLRALGTKICELPAGFNIHTRLKGVNDKKMQSMQTGEDLDWACGEGLAFATLLAEKTHVRLSGQDVERGTFSHRHSVLHDQKDGHKITPLNNLGVPQAKFSVCNSNLSEFGVLGFELGYSMEHPNALVMWEAQFGDFVNGAQIMIDQFISSQEDKWLRQSGLVMLLPHGYEGMGPEHSSCRLERFLQLCDTDLDSYPKQDPNVCLLQQTNWQVIYPTTPANIFHALRRQVHRNFRKPLIVMSPKSLLRHPLAKSTFADMAPGTMFTPVYFENSPGMVPDSQVRKLILCTGKVYYDLIAERSKQSTHDVAIVRLEELNPFPFHIVAQVVKRYKNAEVVWCQEEPKNQGAYFFTDSAIRTSAVYGAGRPASFHVKYAGRKAMASTATGSAKTHTKEQNQLIADALA